MQSEFYCIRRFVYIILSILISIFIYTSLIYLKAQIWNQYTIGTILTNLFIAYFLCEILKDWKKIEKIHYIPKRYKTIKIVYYSH